MMKYPPFNIHWNILTFITTINFIAHRTFFRLSVCLVYTGENITKFGSLKRQVKDTEDRFTKSKLLDLVELLKQFYL